MKVLYLAVGLATLTFTIAVPTGRAVGFQPVRRDSANKVWPPSFLVVFDLTLQLSGQRGKGKCLLMVHS